MSKNKKQVPTIRSSAAEYLSFIASSGEGGVEAIYASEDIWLTQKMMGVLYQVDVRTINYHLKKIFNDNELEEYSVIQDFRITASDGKNYKTKHYHLPAIIAVGYKVNSERAVQFRKWATGIIKEYTIKAYVIDDESEEWYFSIVDIVAVLTDILNPTAYRCKLNERLKKERDQSVTDCHALKMRAADDNMGLQVIFRTPKGQLKGC